MLHSFETQDTTQTIYSGVAASCPFADSSIDEAVTEYFATKYSGLYEDTSNFDISYVSTKPEFMAIAAPDHFNGYASFSKFIYHLENLVSKQAMFDSTFFESDMALREFSAQYASQIEKVWSINLSSKEMPNYTDTFEKFKYLFRTACYLQSIGSPEYIQRRTMDAYILLDLIFIETYKQEYEKRHISNERMMEISKLSYFLSPIIYDSEKKEWNNSPIKNWYRDTYEIIKNLKGDEEPSHTER